MSSGPVASHLVLLDDLEDVAKGTKVRFLGCVDEYIVKTATLRLKHDFPPSRKEPKVANVNIEHVLEVLKASEIDVGSWINVIGHVERREGRGVFVQAVTVWDAGNVDLEAYGKAVRGRKDAS
ncbi:hypothetical protein CC80DRAFT_519936 [Byssothecium circinans]|uniref:CST complex subunit Ten1 n=1 Tax=Byssothecium circinans TaxID=147558 RepID=A0A6A5TFH6_9PLEO|nr:hypothetical protein CC80DRAFT_519936 [Byssothecium circinans]